MLFKFYPQNTNNEHEYNQIIVFQIQSLKMKPSFHYDI